MISTSDIAAKFEATIASFMSVVSTPKDNELCEVQKILPKIFLSVCLAGSEPGKVTDLTLSNPIYLKQPGVTESFDKERKPFNKYDLPIDANTDTWEQRKKQILWSTRLSNQD